MGSSVTLGVFTELGTGIGLRAGQIHPPYTPSSPTQEYPIHLHSSAAQEDMWGAKPYMCAQTLCPPHPLHLLRAMREVETPSSRRSEACHVTCHVKFGLSCQIIPQLILTRGRLHKCATIQCGLDSSISEVSYLLPPRGEDAIVCWHVKYAE